MWLFILNCIMKKFKAIKKTVKICFVKNFNFKILQVSNSNSK